MFLKWQNYKVNRLVVARNQGWWREMVGVTIKREIFTVMDSLYINCSSGYMNVYMLQNGIELPISVF